MTAATRLRLALLATGLGVVLAAAPAWAWWRANGAGRATAATGTLGAPGQPAVSVANGTASLSWTGAVAPGGGASGYLVERRRALGGAWEGACCTTPSARTAATTCADVPGVGTFVWRVTEFFRTWTAVSDQSESRNVGGTDSVPPTGSVTAPAASAALRGTVTVTSNSADAGSGVASAQFQKSPTGAAAWSAIGAADTIAPYAAAWDTTAVADGFYDLRVVTADNVGNPFTSAVVANVRVDNTPPTGTVTAPAASSTVSGSSTTVSSSSADAGSGVAWAQFQTSPGGAGTWTDLGSADAASPYSATWDTTTFANGAYDLRVVTFDRAGNAFTSPTVPVQVQNPLPPAPQSPVPDGAGSSPSPSVLAFLLRMLRLEWSVAPR